MSTASQTSNLIGTSPARSDWAIDLAHVSKTYGRTIHALRGIEMRVRRGEVFGFLGPNGAGKSTLVKILMTVIRPTRAQGTMLGSPIGDKQSLKRVGYLPEHHRFPDYLTGAQVVDFYGAMSGVPGRVRRERVPRLLELVGMQDWAHSKVKGYSKGMRQRIGIAQALINEPELVVLDEPTDGVDPVGRRDIRTVVSRLRDDGKTVFINSHLLSELEMVCDRVAILVKGVVAKQGTLEDLTRDKRYIEIEIAGSGAAAAEDHLRELITRFAKPTSAQGATSASLPGGERVETSQGVLRIYSDDSVLVQPMIDALRDRGAVIRAVRPIRPSLENLFMEAVTDPTTGQVLTPGAEVSTKGRPSPRGGGR